MATVSQLLLLLRAQKAAGFLTFLRLQEAIDTITAQLTSTPPVSRSVAQWVGVLFRAVPLLWWQLLFLSIWAVALLRGATWWREKRFVPLSFCIVFLLLIAPGVWLRSRISSAHEVVVKEATEGYSGPSETFVQMGSFKLGERGVIEAEYRPRPEVVFAKITTNSLRCWIKKSAVETV